MALSSKEKCWGAFLSFHQCFLSPPYPHKESALQRHRAHPAEQMNTGIIHHCCQRSLRLMVIGFDKLTFGHSYVLQRNRVGDHGYRMSWDTTWLRLQEFRVNACLKDDGSCRYFRSSGARDQTPGRGITILV